MMNTNLIENAVRLVVDLFEDEGIYESTESIRKRAIDWYNNTEIVDVEMLAAATITGSYQFGTSWDELISWKNFYFPSTPIEEATTKIIGFHFDEMLLQYENFHISEIESAMEDLLWQ